MAIRQKQIIKPKLNDCKGDISKQWFIYYSFRDDLTGKMTRFRLYEGFKERKTEAEKRAWAKKLIAKWNRKLDRGYNPFTDNKEVVYSDNLTYYNPKEPDRAGRRSRKSTRYYLNKYLEIKKVRLAEGSLRKYQSQFRILNKFLDSKKLSTYDISVIDNTIVTQFLDYLFNTRKVSGKSANTYITILDAVWKLAQKDNKLLKNPWTGIERFREETKPQKPLTKGMLAAIKEHTLKGDPQLWLMIQFEYYTFIRPRELRFLQIQNIDLFEGKVMLHSNITKNSKPRIVQIPEFFQKNLLLHNKLQEYPGHYYLFTTSGKPGKQPVSKNYFWEHFNKVRKALSIPKEYTLYSAKHTGAVAAARNGANIHTIKEQMGHSSVAITEEYLKDKTGYEDDFFRKNMPPIL